LSEKRVGIYQSFTKTNGALVCSYSMKTILYSCAWCTKRKSAKYAELTKNQKFHFSHEEILTLLEIDDIFSSDNSKIRSIPKGEIFL